MKNTRSFQLILTCILLNLATGALFAQTTNPHSSKGIFDEYWYLGLNGGKSHYIGDLNNNDTWGQCNDLSFGGVLGHQISPAFGFRFQYMNGKMSASSDNDFSKTMSTDFWDFGYNMTVNLNELAGKYNPKRFMNVSLFAGPGLFSYHAVVKNMGEVPYMETQGRSNELLLNLGAAASIRLIRELELSIECGFHYSFRDGYLDFIDQVSKNDKFRFVSAGITYKLLPGDKDKDGVSYKHDLCPDLAGLPNLMGCPDADADGVPDKDDTCPQIAGKTNLNGCPDADNDGVPDKDDLCPDIAGLIEMNGCPDKDEDGIADNKDECPDLPGTILTKGCPDQDGDGTADFADRCPETSGDRAFNGCPDRDMDGTPDIDDKCPTVSGPASNNGCPEIKKSKITKVLYFGIEKTKVKKNHLRDLNEIADYLAQNPDSEVTIAGYTDAVGEEDYNMLIAGQRSENVVKYLISKGIEKKRIASNALGEANPASENKTATGRSKNRRVEIGVN